MDAATQKPSSFSCEIRIMRAKDIEFTASKRLFVRYYLSAGNHKRIRLNTRQISSNADFFWNESFSLECLGTEDSIAALRQANVVFELRRAKTVRIAGSQLLGRAAIPWKQVFESKKLGIEKWVSLVSGDGLKKPKLEIGMSVRVAEKMVMEKMRRSNECECGCRCEIGHCAEYDVFAMAAAMEFL